jgi:hypothetical protein
MPRTAFRPDESQPFPPEERERLMAEVTAQVGAPDILVTNAA